MDIIATLTSEFDLKPWQVENTVNLIDEGNTIPFIARYRKEAHGSLDDQVLRELNDRLTYLRNLDKRREEILNSIEEQGKLTDELKAKIDAATVLAELEDLYRPYKQKRRTRAMMAKEKGLEPLAMYLWERKIEEATLEEAAAPYVDAEKGVETVEDALQGASDIIAELISDDADVRKALKEAFTESGIISSKAAKEEDSVYAQYYEFAEAVSKVADHRILALNRGEKEGFLKVSVDLEKEDALRIIDRTMIHSDRKIKKKNRGVNKKKKAGAEAPAPAAAPSPYNEEGCAAALQFVLTAAEDAYDRLIYPSVEREIRSTLKDRADENAIKVFAQNLRPLLMAPPVKNKVVLALDPGYRMGCKTAVVDGTGKVLDTTVIYVTHGDRQYAQAKDTVKKLLKKDNVDVISIGNGTASKETEIFAAETIGEFKQETGRSVSYMVVSEAGASVYSASKHPVRHLHRPPAAGSARGTRQDRPEGHRRRTVPARHAAEGAHRGSGRRRRRLCQLGRRGPQHRVSRAAVAHRRHQRDHREEHRGVPRGERRVHRPRAAQESPETRAEGVRTVRRLPARRGVEEHPRQHGRPPRVLRRGEGPA